MEPPTPTQKPRPISSRLANSPSNQASSSSSSRLSARPRKRPRHRSQPQLADSSTPGLLGVVTAAPDSHAERLDALLAKFALGNTERSEIQASPLRMLSTNISAPSPLRTSSTSTESIKTSLDTSRTWSRGEASSDSVSRISTELSIKPRSLNSLDTSYTSRNSIRSPQSPPKHNAPRIGLRSSQCQSSKQSNLNKAFKSPLLYTNPPIRSSPRRQNSSHNHAHVPHTPVKVVQQKSARPSPHQRNSDETDKTELSEPNAPSSDGPTTGDESFDSFDGMFAEGGDDIEELFKAVDGKGW
jgi:hypothetical protein